VVRGRIRPVTCPSCGKKFSQHGFVGDFVASFEDVVVQEACPYCGKVSEFTEADFIEPEPG